MKISYANNSKLVADIVIDIIFVYKIFVIWSYYTKVVKGRGLWPIEDKNDRQTANFE